MQNYVGKQIDRYRIIERLGMGGMAVVYKAYDTRLERDVALKLIRIDEIPASQHERLLKRFEREAKAMARFSHPNIVPVYDFGEVNNSPYIVMEFIPGGTLKDRICQPVPYQQAVEWLAPIADALAYAHESGVIHRDVKPSNILFDSKGRTILTDFGVAKVLETDEATLTGTGMGVGTPEYMAPEQWRGKTIEATDQYALGIVFYELITGRKPYSADTPAALVILQATEPLPQPSQLNQDIPNEVEKILYKALDIIPENRYSDMSTFHKKMLSLQQKNFSFSTSSPNNQDGFKTLSEDSLQSEEDTFDLLDEPEVETELAIEKSIVNLSLQKKPNIDKAIRINHVDKTKFIDIESSIVTLPNKNKTECEVYLDSFTIYQFPVSNQQFADFLNHTSRQKLDLMLWYQEWKRNNQLLKKNNGIWFAIEGFEDHPITNINWFAAQSYCEWAGGRLPTEAEWIKFKLYEYQFLLNLVDTDSIDNHKFYNRNINSNTIKKPTPFENNHYFEILWEWVSNWYNSEVSYEPLEKNPKGPHNGNYKVILSSAYQESISANNITNRSGYDPIYSHSNIGFRCVQNETSQEAHSTS